MATATKLTLDEFLALPETEPPCEYIHGKVIQKPMPSLLHGLIAAALARIFGNYLEGKGEAFVITEVRHADRDEERAYLPDVGIVRASRMPTDARTMSQGPLEFSPDIAIEILSSDDRPARVSEKVAFYLRTGTEIVWLIDPEEQTLTEFRRGNAARAYNAEASVSAEPVLPGFTLELRRLFSVLPPVDE